MPGWDPTLQLLALMPRACWLLPYGLLHAWTAGCAVSAWLPAQAVRSVRGCRHRLPTGSHEAVEKGWKWPEHRRGVRASDQSCVHSRVSCLQPPFLRKLVPTVSRALPPVGVQSTVEQRWHTACCEAWLNTVVIWKQRAHFTSMK